MQLKVRYLIPFRSITKKREEVFSFSGDTLSVLIDHLTRKYGSRFGEKLIDPQSGKKTDGFTVMVGGRYVDLNATLKEGDEVVFLAPLAGG